MHFSSTLFPNTKLSLLVKMHIKHNRSLLVLQLFLFEKKKKKVSDLETRKHLGKKREKILKYSAGQVDD